VRVTGAAENHICKHPSFGHDIRMQPSTFISSITAFDPASVAQSFTHVMLPLHGPRQLSSDRQAGSPAQVWVDAQQLAITQAAHGVVDHSIPHAV